MKNVRDLVSGLLKDDTVKEKKPFVAEPEPPIVRRGTSPGATERKAPKPKTGASDGLMSRIESMNKGPVAQRSDLPYTLHDHTVEVDGELGGGWLVRSKGGAPLGYIWCDQQMWKWKTMNGEHFGERSTRRKAAEVLVEVHNART